MRKYKIKFIFVLACFLLGLVMVKIYADIRVRELLPWLGKYHFEEIFVGENDFFMLMNYNLEIYQEGTDFYGKLEIIGQTTWITAKVNVQGDSERIDLVFVENLVNETGDVWDYDYEGVLLSLEREGEKIITYWGDCSPMLFENEKPGEYFEKISSK